MDLERAKFLFFGAGVSFVCAVIGAGNVTEGDKGFTELMCIGIAGMVFFGYKIFKFSNGK